MKTIARYALLIMVAVTFGLGQNGSGGIELGGSHGLLTPSSGSTANLVLSGGSTSLVWTGGVPSEIRKPKGEGPSLRFVKASAKHIPAESLAPADYIKLASMVKMDAPSVDEARMLEALHSLNVRTYEYATVDDFLYWQAIKMGTKVRWVWKPMREADKKPVSESTRWTVVPEMGFLYPTVYAKRVPSRVLLTVKDVLSKIPEAVFMVSDFEVIKPDPFLAVSTPKLLPEGKIFIIDQWDEPTFEDRKPDPNALTVRSN